MTEQKVKNGFPDPAWFSEFLASYASSQSFVLHLNTQDYVVPGVRLPAYLSKKMASRDVVVFYDISKGISFPLASMENKAKQLLGMDKRQQNDALAALMEAGGGGMGAPEWPSAPSAALPLLEALLKTDAKVTVVIEYAELILPATDISLMSPDDRRVLITLSRWGTDPIIKKRGNIAFLIVGNLADLHPMLRSASNCFKAIEIPLPDLAARKQFIDWYMDAWELKLGNITADELARMTSGLSLVHIENIFIQADSRGKLTPDLARKAKNDIVNTEYSGFLTILEPTYGFDQIGGMEPLKAWAKREIIDPVRAGNLQDVPKGVILVGPPGTGKTYFVTGLAGEVEFNAASLDPGAIQDSAVGASERNFQKAISAIRSMAPVMVFVDEIDQSDVASRGTNSGNPVAKNLFSMLLRFLGDPANRGKIIFFMASNRPDLIDPALLRFGRTDAIIPVMLPTAEERVSIAKAQARAQGVELGDQVAQYIAERTERYSAADIAAVVTKARKVGKWDGRAGIIGADAMRSLDTIKPATLKNAQYFELVAVESCNDTELLPPAYQKLAQDKDELQQEIEQSAPVRRKREL